MATAYDLTVGVIVNMDEAIYMLSPDDTPLLTGVGADGLSILASRPVDEIQFSWMDDTYLTPRSKLAASATTDETVLTVSSGDRTKFSTGDVLRVAKSGESGDGEIIRVTGYGTTADTLLVSRGFVGTKVNYVTDNIVIGLGTALAEGSDPEEARTVDRVESSNVTQIFGPTKLHLSRTEQLVRKYGVSNEFTHQLMGRMKENAFAREQAFLYGRKSNDSSTKRRTTGGMCEFITTNKDSTNTQVTVSTIQTNQQTCYNVGGLPDRLMANPVALADLNDVANTTLVRVEIDDARRGRLRATQVWTEFGPLTLVRNRWLAPHDAIAFKRDGVIRRVLSPLVFERLAKTGDSDKGQIVCEEGLEVKGQKHMFRFDSLGYSGSN